MNPEFLGEIRLDSKTIERDLNVSRGIARIYQSHLEDKSESGSTGLAIAATYFRRAAADALLLGQYALAKDLFLDAAFTYQKLRSPYCVAMAALSSEGRSETRRFVHAWLGSGDEQMPPDRSYHQLAYVLIAQVTYRESLQLPSRLIKSVRQSLEPYRLRPIGVLGTSTGSVLDLFDSLDPDFGLRRVDLDEAFVPFLGGYNTAIRQAIQSRYHWERLALPFHPAEPDIYSVLILTDSALRMQRDTTVLQVAERAPMSGESRSLLRNILGGITESSENRQRRPHDD